MQKKTGIWLDYDHANIIHLENNEIKTKVLDSGIESVHPKGGSRSKVPYGPMEKISESKYLNRHKAQTKKYYKEVLAQVKDSDEILIMGPGDAKTGFYSSIKNIKFLKPIVREVKTVDSITLNQKVALVRKFFKQEPERLKA